MFPNDAGDDRQSKAGANPRRLSRKKWIKDAILNARRNARTVVRHLEEHFVRGSAPRGHMDCGIFVVACERLPCVSDQILQHLLQLHRNALNEWKCWFQIYFQPDGFIDQVRVMQFDYARNKPVERYAAALS